MSNSSETDLDLDLHFLPAWAQKAEDPNRYAKYAGESAPENRKESWDRRPRPRDRGPQGKRPDRGGPGPRRQEDRRRGERIQRREAPAPAPLPELNVAFKPDDLGVESLARQIRMTGRAYPLFDIAQMVLQKPERHSVTLSVKKKPDGQIAQPMFVCALDETLWLSEDEAVRHLLDKHFSTFYQPERTQIEPPKGVYTFVAQCGMSGAILGPPNYHDYQNQLRKLHAERFSRMPFEAFKSRVKIVRDEAVVKKWIEDQSWKTEYLCLNLPEPLKLGSRAEVETHFRATHLTNIVRQVESFTVSGTAARNFRSPALARLVRFAWEDQRRFPLQIATVLSQQFASHGLQFFKVNRTVTHVAVARPHHLDLDAAPVSEGVKRIVQFIDKNPKCNRRKLVEALAPGPAPAAKLAPVEGTATTPPAATSAPAAETEPSQEATTVISDLHWLIHQGHVIEFANGTLETAKKPLVRPPKAVAAPAPEAETAKTETALGEPAGDSTSSVPPAVAEGSPPPAEPPVLAENSLSPADASPTEQPVPAPQNPVVTERPEVEPTPEQRLS